MNDTKTTNQLLLIIVIPLIFYLLKVLSFIFIPLVFSMFISLLFLPMMRWLLKRRVPKFLSIFFVLIIIGAVFKTGGELIQLSSKEILSADNAFFEMAKTKLVSLVLSLESFFGIESIIEENTLIQFLQKDSMIKRFGSTINFISDTLTMTLMTFFFVILWLSGSINFQGLFVNSALKRKHTILKAFLKIKADLIKFLKVKLIISLLTGISISLACLFFDISFPIFWGLFAFLINFVQMVGSVITVVLLAFFAYIELDPTSLLFFFILTITAIQILFGSILEPVFMGKSFSVNIITILIMLMLWGYIWGIPGLILSVPITVFLKIILEQFQSTKVIAIFFDRPEKKVKFQFKKKQ